MTEQEIIELAAAHFGERDGEDYYDYQLGTHWYGDLECVTAFAQACIARGVEQRDAELIAVGMEPKHLGWTPNNLHPIYGYTAEHLAAARLQERTENFRVAAELLSKAVEDARLQGAEEERKKWQDNLHANVEYCPTCCKGKIASPDMTRDEVIFHCGKTSGRLQGAQRHAELEQQLAACKEGADRMQQVITAVENAMHHEVLNLDVEAAFDAYKAAHNIGGKHD